MKVNENAGGCNGSLLIWQRSVEGGKGMGVTITHTRFDMFQFSENTNAGLISKPEKSESKGSGFLNKIKNNVSAIAATVLGATGSVIGGYVGLSAGITSGLQTFGWGALGPILGVLTLPSTIALGAVGMAIGAVTGVGIGVLAGVGVGALHNRHAKKS